MHLIIGNAFALYQRSFKYPKKSILMNARQNSSASETETSYAVRGTLSLPSTFM